jgi:hypothetical protein
MTLNIKAVFAGWLISYIGQLVMNKPILVAFVWAGMNGSTDFATLQRVMDDLRTSVPLHIIELFTQTIASVAGVHYTVQSAKGASLKHSLALGILILVSTTLFALNTLRVWPVWYSALSLFLPVPTAFVAGRWSARKIGTVAPTKASGPPIPAP